MPAIIPVRPDKPLCIDDKGYPIFGYNKAGRPVCFSRKKGGAVNVRCMREERFPNGRCKFHGGLSRAGSEHPNYKLGVFSKQLELGNLVTLVDAVADPNYTSLREEIGLNFLRVNALVKEVDFGTDEGTWKKIEKQAIALENLMFSKQVGDFMTRMGPEYSSVAQMAEVSEQLVKLIRYGRDQRKILKELDDALLTRAKLIEYETKKLNFERTHMTAEAVFHLFKTIIGVVKKVWGHDTVSMEAFGLAIDEVAGTLYGEAREAVGGKPGVSGMVKPQSKLVDGIRRGQVADHYDNVIKSSPEEDEEDFYDEAPYEEIIDAEFEPFVEDKPAEIFKKPVVKFNNLRSK